jgi:hypothetical protein
MFSIILAAILWLSPKMAQYDAQNYAQIIKVEATRKNIDPLLIVAVIYRESRFRPHVFSAQNYGLMQVRVTENLNSDFWQKEKMLFKPSTNIRRGVKWLSLWRGYHQKQCGEKNHHWWSHYQWGGRVHNRGSGDRVGAIYELLKAKFYAGTV